MSDLYNITQDIESLICEIDFGTFSNQSEALSAVTKVLWKISAQLDKIETAVNERPTEHRVSEMIRDEMEGRPEWTR